MPDEIDPKTGKPKSEPQRRVEALEADNANLKETVSALQKDIESLKEAKRKAAEDEDSWAEWAAKE